MSEQIYVKGSKVKVVSTPAERVAAEFDGYRPSKDESAPEGAEQVNAAPTPDFQDSSALTDSDPDVDRLDNEGGPGPRPSDF